LHFILRATSEFRDPSQRFDTRYYLGRNPVVAQSGINPLLHFALFGKKEGREIISRKPMAAPFQRTKTMPNGMPAAIINNDWRPDHPLVSAVIPVFNNAQFLEEGIHSVLNQTFKDLELIIVEGGSTDPAAVATVRRLEATQLPRTRFYYRPERHHVGDNKNFGAGMARGRYVFCLDQDDMVGAVFVEVAVFLAEVYGYDLVYPSLRAFGDPKARWAYGDSNLRWLVQDPSFPQILCANQVPNCGLCRRSAWVHIGGYRDFGTHENYISEDWDFWIRYLGHGYRGISIRQCLQFYRVTDTGMTASYKPDLNEQRRRLATVNAALVSSGQPAPPALPAVINPYSNLEPLPQANGAVMLGLPATPTLQAVTLFEQWTQEARDRGQVLVVVTSWTTEEAQSEKAWLMPDEPYNFAGITPHIYHLSWLFRHDDHRTEFLHYLIQRYSIRSIAVAGCEFLEAALPHLQSASPGIEAVRLDLSGPALRRARATDG
jgi:GT2 family glycosyltransferase